jgi:hypothetical protein
MFHEMDLWIQLCVPCATLYGAPACTEPHETLTLNGKGTIGTERVEEHYTCTRCCGAFARILAGASSPQIWLLLNAGQH